MSNIIEEFVIKFLTDSKEATKGARQVDKLMDDIGKKQVKRSQANYKTENKAHKTMLANKLKEEEYFSRSSKLRAEKARKEWERREKISSLLPNNTLSNKSAQSSASVFEKGFSDEAKAQVRLSKEKAAAERAQRTEMAKTRKEAISSLTAQKDGMADLKSYYKAQEAAADKAAKAQEKINIAIQRQQDMIRSTAGFRAAKKFGKSGQIESEMSRMVNEKDLDGLTKLRRRMVDVRQDMQKYNSTIKKTGVIQSGLTDSTRNMIRSYASMFALFEGTTAIKRVGQDFQAMEASMLAASGSVPAAAKDMVFINGIVDEMGLSLKDTTDAFVKFKFAAKGKITQSDQENIFESLSMFGTSLKVGNEDMKRATRGIIQMMSKGQVMAEELKNQLNQELSCLV